MKLGANFIYELLNELKIILLVSPKPQKNVSFGSSKVILLRQNPQKM